MNTVPIKSETDLFTRLAPLVIILICLAFDFSVEATYAESPSREKWHNQLNWDTSECPLNSPDNANPGVSVHKFSSGINLAIVECERWAYQSTFYVYLLKQNGEIQLNFEQYESPASGRLERYKSPLIVGEVTFDDSRDSIYIFRKYRGPGDCGQLLRYEISGDETILRELRVHECGKIPSRESIDPKTWPRHKL